jgi:hypothetical protein
MSEITSGPWEVHPIQKLAVHQPEYECWIPQNEADVRLIAAAPELYEALERIKLTGVFVGAIAQEMMEAALKKARGE